MRLQDSSVGGEDLSVALCRTEERDVFKVGVPFGGFVAD
jgi:hypothetical protein